jgi:hypothetical protein
MSKPRRVGVNLPPQSSEILFFWSIIFEKIVDPPHNFFDFETPLKIISADRQIKKPEIPFYKIPIKQIAKAMFYFDGKKTRLRSKHSVLYTNIF